jgi:hypothetical protein
VVDEVEREVGAGAKKGVFAQAEAAGQLHRPLRQVPPPHSLSE